MQTTFSINLLALVDGEPRTLTLKQALRVYLEHRLTVIKRRAQFDLDKAKARAHILEGYLTALKNLDEIINLIRSAPDVETARTKLMKRYKLTEIQATAILDMQLRRLAALERKKIETEYKEVEAVIKDLTKLLKTPKLMRDLVAEELLKVKEAYGDRRRTQIVSVKEGAKSGKALTTSELLPQQTVWIGVTNDGLVSRTADEKQPRHSGNDAPRYLVKAFTTDTVYFVSNRGKAAAIAVHLIPQANKLSQGVPWHRVSPLSDSDALAAVFALPSNKSSLGEEICVITATRFGMIKKSLITELPGPSSQTFALVKINEGDKLGMVGITNGKKEVLLVTANGMAIRFKEDDVRPMGLVAAGVNGMKLEEKDEVIGAEILPAAGDIFMLTNEGKAKRVSEKDFPVQGRYGKGVAAWDLPGKSQLVAIASGKPNHVATVHMTKGAPKSTRLDSAGLRKRASSKGDVVIEVKPGESIVSIASDWALDSYVALSPKGKTESEKKKAPKASAKKAPKAKAKPASNKKGAKSKASKPVKKKPAKGKKK